MEVITARVLLRQYHIAVARTRFNASPGMRDRRTCGISHHVRIAGRRGLRASSAR